MISLDQFSEGNSKKNHFKMVAVNDYADMFLVFGECKEKCHCRRTNLYWVLAGKKASHKCNQANGCKILGNSQLACYRNPGPCSRWFWDYMYWLQLEEEGWIKSCGWRYENKCLAETWEWPEPLLHGYYEKRISYSNWLSNDTEEDPNFTYNILWLMRNFYKNIQNSKTFVQSIEEIPNSV